MIVTDAVPGAGLVRAAVWGAGLFTVTATAGAIFPDELGVASAVFACGLFAVGTVVFAVGILIAIGRSRYEVVAVSQLFGLGGVAPPGVRRAFHLSLAVEVVVALVTASIRPFTPLAFGVLVPVHALGLTGLWAARHGEFDERH